MIKELILEADRIIDKECEFNRCYECAYNKMINEKTMCNRVYDLKAKYSKKTN